MSIADAMGDIPNDSMTYSHVSNYNLGLLKNPVWIKLRLDSSYFRDVEVITIARPRVKIEQLYVEENGSFKPLSVFTGTTLNAVSLKGIPLNSALFYKIENTGAGQQVRVEKFTTLSQFYFKERLNRSINWINLFFIIVLLLFARLSYHRITKEFYMFTVSLMLIMGIILFADSGIYKYIPFVNMGYALSSIGFLGLLIFIIALTRQITDLEKRKAKKTTKTILIVFIALTLGHFIDPLTTTYISVALQSFIILACAYLSFKTLINKSKIRSFRFAALGIIILCVFSILKMMQSIGLLEGWLIEVSMIVAFFSEILLWSVVFFFLIYKEEIKIVQASVAEKSDSETTNKELVLSLEHERQKIRTHADKTLLPSLEKTMKYLRQNSINQAIEELDASITTVRYLSRLYIKPNVKERDVKEEILRFIDLVQGVKDIHIHLDYELNKDNISEYLQINLYRIVQEAISNMVSHSNADTIFIQILSEERNIYINAEDNGTAFEGKPEEGSGIKSIRARLSEFDYFLRLSIEEGIGGRLEIELKDVV